MNYICLITLIMSAGDGKSWPAAKGRYKYSNMKTKNPTTLPCAHHIETFNTAQRWLLTQFSAFQTLSEPWLWGRRAAVLQRVLLVAPWTLSGGVHLGYLGKEEEMSPGAFGHYRCCPSPPSETELEVVGAVTTVTTWVPRGSGRPSPRWVRVTVTLLISHNEFLSSSAWLHHTGAITAGSSSPSWF